VNEFKAWMQAMGFNGKQVVKAGQAIGMGASTALQCHAGKRRLTSTEKLAMSAVAAGLPDWNMDNHSSAKTLAKIVAAAAELQRAS
jgi:hypothetical protein